MVGGEFYAIVVGAENQSASMNRMQYRQVEADALAPGDVQVDVGVDFAVVGQIDSNVPGAVQVRILEQVQSEVLGSLLLLLLSLGTAGVGFWFCCQRFCQVNAALAALRSYALYQSRMLEQLATTAKGAEGSLVFNARTEPKSRWEP